MTTSIDKSKIKILLLEGIHQRAVDFFTSQGYENVELLPKALQGQELLDKIKDAHFIGIRSRTHLTKEVFEAAKKLIAVGCFCIGTNQVDLEAAKKRGIPVFNAPFANTRSVAEFTIATIIHLMRGIPEKNLAAHEGRWLKSAENSNEVRGKNLGIVGYGNIGSQLSTIASMLGMHVYYYDIEKKLALGNAQMINSLEELLKISDVVTLHVPETPETKNMMNAETLAQMKDGSYLINYARGTLIDIDELVKALESKRILGAALDVFPAEPKSKEDEFVSPLREFQNVLISPHIGGSTQEAQENIGDEVAEKLVKYSDNGSTTSAFNFPVVSLPRQNKGFQRILNIHENVPGVLREINKIFAENNINIVGQFLQTDSDVGYVVLDVETDKDLGGFLNLVQDLPASIKTRVLY